jgi:hypothetical protein
VLKKHKIYIFNTVLYLRFYLRLIFLFWSDLIIICLKLRLCCGIVGSNTGSDLAASIAGSDLAFDCLAFDFFCTTCCGDCDLIIKWFGDGSLNNGFGGGGIGRFEVGAPGNDGARGGGIGNEGARGGGIGKNEGGR